MTTDRLNQLADILKAGDYATADVSREEWEAYSETVEADCETMDADDFEERAYGRYDEPFAIRHGSTFH